ncbi:hypothetical protein DFR68_105466 [Nocardia mexicana]|uniref:Uncharacterized protein n=1 Tax=Nocardia mexicana TaxID=279262 RepID=A0A370H466_9NOCA|nr:hypothetical protein DFR68_105466 [Nocardia mexicana]
MSIAAHALGGGAITLGSTALTLLVTACTLTGVLVAAVGTGLPRLMLMLAAGQAIGHAALSMSPEHCHAAMFSSAMLTAHLVAIPVGALLVRGAEVALGRVLSSVRRAVVALVRTVPAPSGSPLIPRRGQVATPRRLLVSSGIGRRGPPWHRDFSFFLHRSADLAIA